MDLGRVLPITMSPITHHGGLTFPRWSVALSANKNELSVAIQLREAISLHTLMAIWLFSFVQTILLWTTINILVLCVFVFSGLPSPQARRGGLKILEVDRDRMQRSFGQAREVRTPAHLPSYIEAATTSDRALQGPIKIWKNHKTNTVHQLRSAGGAFLWGFRRF